MKTCPNCNIALKPKSVGKVDVDVCTECKGTWYDKGEFKRAKDQKDPDLNWMDFDIWKHEKLFQTDPSHRKCPICNQTMVAVAYDKTGVTVDFCIECEGTWLEKNEFRKIIKALETELESKSFSEYIRAAIKEGVEIIAGRESLASEWKDFLTVLRLMEYRLFVENKSLHKAITSVQKSAQ